MDAYNAGALVAVDDTVSEMHKFVRSIMIKADSRQLLYLDNAKHFLSIVQQRKKDATQHLISDFTDYPLEFVAGNTNAAAGNVNAGIPVAPIPMSEKQLALYWYI